MFLNRYLKIEFIAGALKGFCFCRHLLLLIVFALGPMASAQFDDAEGETDPEVEALYDQLDAKQDQQSQRMRRKSRSSSRTEIQNLGQLSELEPFEDIAVIQRRYLPKTGRFELALNGMTTLNNPFFNNIGAGLKGAYFFKEKYGVEFTYLFLSNTERSVTEQLREKRSINTESVVTPKSFMGAAFKWNPIFGKITWLNNKIVPFDLHFLAGGGLTNTGQKDGEPTVHLGTGQLYALSKGMGFRWDLTWNFYSATSLDENGRETSVNQDDLYFSIGLSFFFPEATYR